MTTREVILDGGSPWGFRMHGGADLQQRLRISRVNPGSKASFKGIREGDFITSIDGQSTKSLTNSEAHTLLKSAGDQLKLGLNEEFNDSYKQKKYKTVIQETYSETIKNCHIMSSTETYLTTNKLKETNEEEKNSHSNCVNSEGFTSSSSTSVDSPNSLDLRGKNLGNLINEKDIMDNLKILQEKNGYRVESPPPVLKLEIAKKSPDKTPIITEIDDDNTCLECNTDTVVVNDLDIIWETTEELNPIKEELGHLTTISNKEENLRQFLESLQFDEISKFSIEGIKSITNLDVINEEEGDITEVEQESSKVSTENKLPTKNIKAFKNDCIKISPDLQIIKHKGKEEVFEQNLNNKCNNNEEEEINCYKNNKISLLDMIKYQSNDLSENTKFFVKESNLQSNEIKLNENCSSTILLKEDVTYNNLNEEICSLKISSSEELTKKDIINKIDDQVKFLSQENCVKPNTLRELCIKYLASFPFGIDILEELAQVSKQLENLTTHLPKKYINKHQNSVPNYFNIFKNQISKLNKNDLCNTKNVNKIIEQKNPKYFLPNMYIVKQMQYLIDCEKEIQEELEILENEKRRLLQQEYSLLHLSNSNKILNPKEIQNEEMYNEYMNKLSAHKYRQAKNIIKITTNNNNYNNNSSQINDLESEFIKKARKRLEKQGLNLDGMNTKILSKQENLDETNVTKQVLENFVASPQKVKVRVGNINRKNAIRIFKALKKNRQSYARYSLLHEIDANLVLAKGFLLSTGVWSPGQKRHFDREELHREISQDSSQDKSDETIPPVWTPRSAGSSPTSERKEFRPVNFESPTLGRKERTKSDGSSSNQDVPWKRKSENFDEKTLTSSHSAPGPGLLDFSRLPRAQNPTITLLQKAREGQIPKPTSCVESSLRSNGPTAFSNTAPNTRPESFSDSDGERSKIITHIVSSKKIDGIGPTTKDGMPLHLRSEIRDANMSQWYKNMYDTIHKQKPTRYDDEEYVTVRYKQRRAGKYPYTTGYLSEPEVATYDSDAALNDNKYSTLDRRRPVTTKQITRTSSTLPRTDTTIISYTPETLRSSDSNKTPPGKIENYKPGQSSISDNDAKKWWDEVMEIFDGPLEQHRRSPQTKGYLSQALKESGYESDSTLVFRRKDETTQQLSPQEQREVYKIIQKGGEVPLHGLRKLAPERPKEIMEVEYFPISQTLNRIRVHKSNKVKNVRPISGVSKRALNSPNQWDSINTTKLANVKKSGVQPKILPANRAPVLGLSRLCKSYSPLNSSNCSLNQPPNPPKRKSSRNNSTLRLISNMHLKPDKHGKRHETCFTSTTNVKKIGEKIASKMSPMTLRKIDLGSKATTLKSQHSCRSTSPSVPKLTEKSKKTTKVSSVDKSNLSKSCSSITKVGSNSKLSQKTSKYQRDKVGSPIPSIISEKTRSSIASSMDSLRSTTKSPTITKPVKNLKIKKSKKDQINVEILNKCNKSKTTKKNLKLKAPEKNDTFFQSLLLKENTTKSREDVSKKIVAKKEVKPDKSINAITFYLNQTKPVTSSRFKQIDRFCRSRSSSPKSIIWNCDKSERSMSLPPRIVINHGLDSNNNTKRIFFSETNRPVSPIFTALKPTTIKISPSPSYRKIRHVRKENSLDLGPELETKEFFPKINYSRFKELNNFYRDLEKLEKLEKTALSKELLPRRKCEDQIIDYDRWQEIRTRERAEKEFKYLYDRLKFFQKEKDFLFKPKEVHKWRCEVERGLQFKEKSVENIKEKFENLHDENERGLNEKLFYEREVYKPLWRGNSVVNLAQSINENRSQSEGRVANVKKMLDTEKLLSHGIGSRIWSSLSLEQVDILKNQLSEIYGNDSKFQKNNYTINVSLKEHKPPSNLKVRRNSDVIENKKLITEQEKKKISLNLSKEVLERQREKLKNYNFPESRPAVSESPRTCYSLEISEDDTKKLKDNDLLVILTDDSKIRSYPKSISSETDSTEGSNKTVIFTNKDKILEKVDYFEHISERNPYTPVIYQPLDDEVNEEEVIKKKNKFHSRSHENLKELYGEEHLKDLSQSPICKKLPKTRIYYKDRSASPYSDTEIIKSSYDINELKRKFEDYFSLSKKWSSNPELNREYKKVVIPGQGVGDVQNLRMSFEYPNKVGRGRSRYRRGGVVSPIHMKHDDRFMPHINIISKIASLYPKKSDLGEKTQSSEELASILGIPYGEVEKLRQRFDSPTTTSILGQMFTSSPNINELRDIAQYLTCSWIAHKYPKQEHNSLRSNKILRPKSTSPKRPLTPILKQQKENDLTKRSSSVSKFDQPKYRSWWPPSPTHARPSVKFKEPESPPTLPHVEKSQSDPEQESPRKYIENEVTIHYKAPIRQEIKESLSEDELARRQADAMRKIYEEERRRKYLQVSHSDDELHDIKSRRHTDNFIPSQKSPIPLNRYDNFPNEYESKIVSRPKSPEPRLVARALYNFVGQTSRELTFKKGDMIYIRRQVDKNWYEGEINAMVGLFPANYVEIVPYDGVKSTPRKPNEGQARAKYNFIAQTHLELSLARGELVVVTRRVDDNWFEGRIGGRKGIFPVSYVEVLVDPSESTPSNNPTKPTASPASHSLLLNGSAGGKESMGTHSYVPSFPSPDLGVSYRAKPIQMSGNGTYGSLKKNPVDKALHIETQSEPIPYRALYKYRPQNEDELELLEGDTVYVLEKCDDGWYVGSSERTGSFGTFPGNYVERI